VRWLVHFAGKRFCLIEQIELRKRGNLRVLDELSGCIQGC